MTKRKLRSFLLSMLAIPCVNWQDRVIVQFDKSFAAILYCAFLMGHVVFKVSQANVLGFTGGFVAPNLVLPFDYGNMLIWHLETSGVH